MSVIVDTFSDFLIAIQPELRGHMIAGAELLWDDMLRLREAYHQLAFIDMIVTKDSKENLAVLANAYRIASFQHR